MKQIVILIVQYPAWKVKLNFIKVMMNPQLITWILKLSAMKMSLKIVLNI